MKSTRLLLSAVAIIGLVPGWSTFSAAQKKDKPAKYLGLAHINIMTKDLEKSIRFYQDNLQFSVTARSELTRPEGVTKMALLQQGSCIIELAQPPKPESVTEKARGTIGHFALRVRNIDKVVADLKAKGITLDRDVFTMDQLFGGIRGAFISGPSGESIELFEFMNKGAGKAKKK